MNKSIVNPENKIVNSTDRIDWEETEGEVSSPRTLVIHMNGGSRKRGTQACEIRALAGEYFVAD